MYYDKYPVKDLLSALTTYVIVCLLSTDKIFFYLG
jgi:hypothetical protein